ncbi:M28 family metallopeptidase [Luteimonas sp. R10]|uniref:M28 family metallopeptidase n=1 Tax=Luteimonas sp. R10 TaxID=3108176 RepID=UPI003086193C|nr:M28 family metallopeptidase [Luteimonas sp. R10]
MRDPYRQLAAAFAAFALLVACDRSATDGNRQPVATATAPAGAGDGWRSDLAAIASAGDNAARLGAIRQRLQAIGLAPAETAFDGGGRSGTNLTAAVSGGDGAPLLLLGAHADRVDQGDGATDNASGAAVVLALAQRLRERPLAHHRVAVAFWDLEEAGLLGSRAYVAEGGERPALYVNFDVFGWGDTLWMMTPDPAHRLVADSAAAAAAAGTGFAPGEQYPPTDHRAFLEAGWPAVSYSLVGGDEIPSILAMYDGKRPDPLPKVMRVIHSPDDTIDQVDPAAAARGIDVVEDALRRWDAGTAPD